MLQLRRRETILRNHATNIISLQSDLTDQGEATMRYMEMLASTVVTVGTLALVAGVFSL
ncbi:hypothetical protein [Sphingomonas sp.]|uniref:hypothetical protein n=1 Tax=Sphingomonas sp. TaxID=28214 RepID=UPI0025CC27B0|nr:hypothetical protein [Sphingomonas sp.]